MADVARGIRRRFARPPRIQAQEFEGPSRLVLRRVLRETPEMREIRRRVFGQWRYR